MATKLLQHAKLINNDNDKNSNDNTNTDNISSSN